MHPVARWHHLMLLLAVLGFGAVGLAQNAPAGATRGATIHFKNGRLRFAQPGFRLPVVDAPEWRIGPLCQGPDGWILVAVHQPEFKSPSPRERPLVTLWRVNPADPLKYGGDPRTGVMAAVAVSTDVKEVRAMAACGDTIWVASNVGLLQVRGSSAEVYAPEILSASLPPAISDGWGQWARSVSVGAGGWVWLSSWDAPVSVFQGCDPQPPKRVYFLGGARPAHIAASAGVPGAWALFPKSEGGMAAIRIMPEVPGASTSDPVGVLKLPSAPVPFQMPSGTRDQQRVAGAPVLSITDVRLAVDPQGQLWAAGRDRAGVHVFLCRDGTCQEQAAPEILGSSRITDLAVAHDGKLYAATDGAGVLVFDGQRWEPHPINQHLPRLIESDLRPVSHILPLRDGRLCASVGASLYIW